MEHKSDARQLWCWSRYVPVDESDGDISNSKVEITGTDSASSVDIQAWEWVEVKCQVYHTAQNI
jgi:hypothetical protein